jgi:hypothetical protein
MFIIMVRNRGRISQNTAMDAHLESLREKWNGRDKGGSGNFLSISYIVSTWKAC